MKRRTFLLGLPASIGAVAGGCPYTLPAALAAPGGVPLAATPLSRSDLPWWTRRHLEKRQESMTRHPTLVWLGDSITQNFERSGPGTLNDYVPVWQHFYGDRNAINLGFSGDTTAHVLWRVLNGELDGAAAKLVIVLVGANNLGLVHWSAPDTLAGIAAIMQALRQRAPQASVLLLSVLPRDGDAWVLETRRAVNRGLAAAYGHAPGVIYVDLTGLFEQDGRINNSLYVDPQASPPHYALHPTPQGMAAIATRIEPIVAGVLGDRNHVTS